jgi:hypothetical protein
VASAAMDLGESEPRQGVKDLPASNDGELHRARSTTS